MMWFLYYNSGHCNEGDHRCELLDFSSKEEALAHIEKLKKDFCIDDATVCLIEGIEHDLG